MTRSASTTREDRLKAALKANMGRRKAQARARAEPREPDEAAAPPAPEREES
jgi:hypothetical protein